MREVWRHVPISELATFCSGGTPNKGRPDYWNGPIPWVTVKDMKLMRLNGVGESLTDEGAKTVRVVPPGSVLVLVRGMGLFKRLPVVLCDRSVTFNQDIKGLIPNDGVDGEFLALSIVARQSDILRHVDTAGHGTGRLDTELLKSTPILVPSLSEQRRIAEILRTWDEALENLNALRAAKEQQFSGLHKKLMDQDFKSYGDILEQYAIIPILKSITSTDGLKSLTVKIHCKGIVPSIQARPIKLSDKGRPYYRRKSGDMLISRQSFHNGGFGIVPPELDGFIASNAITSLRVDSSKIDMQYLFYFFSRKDYYPRIGRIMDGTAQKELSDKQIGKLPVSIPSLEKQAEVVQILTVANQEIALIDANIEALTLQKRGLMQKLLTGEWRVTPESRS